MRWFSGLDCGIPVHIAATPRSIAASPYGSVSLSLSDSRSNGPVGRIRAYPCKNIFLDFLLYSRKYVSLPILVVGA